VWPQAGNVLKYPCADKSPALMSEADAGGTLSMDDPTRWLEESAPGFDQLSAQEREAIKNFALLWSLYEGRVLNTQGNAINIIQAVESLKKQGKLTLAPFRPAIDYFSKRYYDGTNLTPDFDGLEFKKPDRRSLVKSVVRGQSSDDAEILSAILIIVLRLRNNLFRGIKWQYGIRGQLQNFCSANDVLMSTISLHQS
jgi:hypothetical protein